ncbi:MAG: tRNA (adenosine(37)-N6)-threonylcarbamoyltransferase complex ATPase subunit type 1 TsaE [Saprospiraceae bacterium]
MKITITNQNELEKVVKAYLKMSDDNKVAFLYGDLGTGKTTFVNQLVNYLGSKDKVSSPTYSIVNEYQTDKGLLYHIDLYRLDNIEEALDIGIEEYLDSGNYCLIEWPQIIENLVDKFIEIKIETLGSSSRMFEIKKYK